MTQSTAQRTDVVIVGGGIVGATMAALLAELPLRVVLIDRGTWEEAPALLPDEFDSRVSALTVATRHCFMDLGVWPGIAGRRYCPYREMRVWDADGTGSIHFSAADIDQDELGTIVENSVVMAALRERLELIDNLEILAGQTVNELEMPAGDGDTDGGVLLGTDRGMRLHAALLIAADGANSPLRAMAGFRTREWDYGHEAIVTTVRTSKAHKHTAWQRFMETGPLAFLPLLPAPESDNQHFCSIVWSTTPAEAERLLALADTAFCRELGSSIEQRLGEIEHAAPRYSFPLRQRHAIDYVKPGVALIGDAAHTIHPLAGQGVNLGILDAVALAAELRRGLQAGRQPGDITLLRRYQRARIGHNLSMMWLMEGFKHLFAAQALPVRWLRNMGMSGVDNLAVVKNQLARRAMGLE